MKDCDNKKKNGAESSLHKSLKLRLAEPGDRQEARVEDYLVDVVKDGLLIEIQTGHFTQIKDKLTRLLANHKVQLVYPLPEKKTIIYLDSATGEKLKERKSPQKGELTDIFKELIRIPEFVNDANFSLAVYLIDMAEIRCDDGKGSWRRKGVSILDRVLQGVNQVVLFENSHDFLRLLPQDLPINFTTGMLAERMGLTRKQVQRMVYCLKKMGLLKEIGHRKRELLYELSAKSLSDD